MSQTILITGAAGFLGRYTAQYFSGLGWSVIGIDSVSPENAPGQALSAYYCMKLPDGQLSGLLKKHAPDACIHFAGRASVPLSVSDPSADFYANTVLCFEMLEALRLHAPGCTFILPSSAAVYGNPASLPVGEDAPVAPISPYGFHKRQCEELCREYSVVYGLKTAAARIFSAYGPGLRRQVIWDICRKAVTGEDLVLQGTGRESRDFIHALDIARALHTIAERGSLTGTAYNLASGEETATGTLAALVLEALESRHEFRFDGRLPAGVPSNWRADLTRLHALGFHHSIPLPEGIKTFAHWCRAELTGL